MTSFGVVGLGLIGGSIARALRADDAGAEIVGVETDPSTRAAAQKSGAVSHAVDSATDADLEKCSTVFVCTCNDTEPRSSGGMLRFRIEHAFSHFGGPSGNSGD